MFSLGSVTVDGSGAGTGIRSRKHEPSRTILCIPLNLRENNAVFKALQVWRNTIQQSATKYSLGKFSQSWRIQQILPPALGQSNAMRCDEHIFRFALVARFSHLVVHELSSLSILDPPKIAAWSNLLGCSPVTVIASKGSGLGRKNHFAKKNSYHLTILQYSLQVTYGDFHS